MVEEELPSSAIISWGQLELQLGLFEGAAEKFDLVQDSIMAAYGKGLALLATAERDAQDGKVGVAYTKIVTAINTLEALQGEELFVCVNKLLGDLYSFASRLPPDVFQQGSQHQQDSKILTDCKLEFVSCGENAYKKAASKATISFENESNSEVEAVLLSDRGTNQFLQAQILSSLNGEGHGIGSNNGFMDVVSRRETVQHALGKAKDSFEKALDIDPESTIAWCGLGCASIAQDPINAQHAWSRTLQLDKMLPDAWSNLGFMYASQSKEKLSVEMMDALTQVADTPLM